jgi:hypothetical protein
MHGREWDTKGRVGEVVGQLVTLVLQSLTSFNPSCTVISKRSRSPGRRLRSGDAPSRT